MEVAVIQSRAHMSHRTVIAKVNFSETSPPPPPRRPPSPTMSTGNLTRIELIRTNYTSTEFPTWSNSEFVFNLTASLSSDLDYDFQASSFNGSSFLTTVSAAGEGAADSNSTSWGTCKEWTPAQHTLFQTANFFFAAAFLVPGSFKQSVLIVRGLLSIGYMFLTVWGGTEVCAPDILLWNLLLVILNVTHTALLTWRFLPPTLTLELTELYLKMFKPFRVSKKHFKELVKEAKVLTLEQGDIYAVEDVSPADERLSILLKGKLRVTCDDTHLHFINVHQFVDSPEWESNHEQSDDVFQVTITAEEDSTYICWPRMKLERILRHRPMLKVVMDSIIESRASEAYCHELPVQKQGKDITQKLYALNEHLSGLSEERKRGRRNQIWANSHSRSMSMDAVNTGTTGLVRSQAYRTNQVKNSLNPNEMGSLGKLQNKCWVPLVAKHFPATSPFMGRNPNSLRIPEPEVHSLVKTRSLRRNAREVKFESPPPQK